MNLPNDNWRDTEAILAGGRVSQGKADDTPAKPDRSPARPCSAHDDGQHRWSFNRISVIKGVTVSEFKCACRQTTIGE
jgi:hypothetical protein